MDSDKLLDITPIWFPVSEKKCAGCGASLRAGKPKRWLYNHVENHDASDIGVARFMYQWIHDGRHVTQYLCGVCTCIETSRDSEHRKLVRDGEFDRHSMANRNKKVYGEIIRKNSEYIKQYKDIIDKGETPSCARGILLLSDFLPEDLTQKMLIVTGLMKKTEEQITAEKEKLENKKIKSVKKLEKRFSDFMRELKKLLEKLTLAQMEVKLAHSGKYDFDDKYNAFVSVKKEISQLVESIGNEE